MFVHGYRESNVIEDFNQRFKALVLPRIAECLRPDLKYFANGSLGLSRFVTSGLMSKRTEFVFESDEFRGQIGSVRFSMREVKSSSPAPPAIVLNFHFPKKFKGLTLISPDTLDPAYGSYLSGIVQDLTLLGRKVKRVSLENPHFEEHYLVTSTDQQEARYLITPKMMELLLALREEFRKSFHFSFFEGQLYIMVPSQRIHLEITSLDGFDSIVASMESSLAIAERTIKILEIEGLFPARIA